MAKLNELDALYAFLTAAAVTALLTPFTMRLARAVGAVDEPRERGLSDRATPLLGGLAIFAGVLVASARLPAGGLRLEQRDVARRADRGRTHNARRRTGRPLRSAAARKARRPDRGSRDRRALRRRGEVDHPAVRRHLAFPKRRPHQRGPGADRHRPRRDDEHRQPLRRRRRPRRGRLRDHRGNARDHRLRSRPRRTGRAGGADGRRSARLPDPQLPTGLELHGRLRGQPAGPADGGGGCRGSGQDAGCRVLRAAADPVDRTVLGHHLRGAQALEVQAPDLCRRQRALPPSHGPHRLLQQTHDRIPVRVDADARRLRAGAAFRALLRPQRPAVSQAGHW